MRGPTDSIKSSEAITTIQTTNGSRIRLMPLARRFNGVVIKFIPPIITAANSRARPMTHRLIPQLTPVNSALALSGAYAVQPAAKGPPGTKKDAVITTLERKNVQKDIMFRKGKVVRHEKTPVASFETVVWDGRMPDVLEFSRPALEFVGLPVREESREGNEVRMIPSPDIAYVRFRAQPVLGGTLGLHPYSRRERILSVKPGPGGEIRVIGLIGRPLEGELWERTDSDSFFRGRVRIVPDRREVVYDLEMGGRWVEMDCSGRKRSLDVYASDAPTARTYLGRLVVGSPFRCWVPDGTEELVLQTSGKVKARFRLDPDTDMVRANLGDG